MDLKCIVIGREVAFHTYLDYTQKMRIRVPFQKLPETTYRLLEGTIRYTDPVTFLDEAVHEPLIDQITIEKDYGAEDPRERWEKFFARQIRKEGGIVRKVRGRLGRLFAEGRGYVEVNFERRGIKNLPSERQSCSLAFVIRKNREQQTECVCGHIQVPSTYVPDLGVPMGSKRLCRAVLDPRSLF